MTTSNIEEFASLEIIFRSYLLGCGESETQNEHTCRSRHPCQVPLSCSTLFLRPSCSLNLELSTSSQLAGWESLILLSPGTWVTGGPPL